MQNNVKIIHFPYDLTELHHGSEFRLPNPCKSLMYMNKVTDSLAHGLVQLKRQIWFSWIYVFSLDLKKLKTVLEYRVRVKSICKTWRPLTIPSLRSLTFFAKAGPAVLVSIGTRRPCAVADWGMLENCRNLSSAKRTARVELLTPCVNPWPMSLSSIVRSLISIPESRTAAIVSGSSSLVTSISFSSDSAARLKARRVGIAEKNSQVAEIAATQAMKLRIWIWRWVRVHWESWGADEDPTVEFKLEITNGSDDDEAVSDWTERDANWRWRNLILNLRP